jgi:hypothetical protein
MMTRILALAASAATLAAAVHAAPAAHPDISGVWLPRTINETKTLDGKDPPLKAGKRDTKADPVRSCLPAGPVRAMVIPYPVKILSRPDQVTFMFEFYHMTKLAKIGASHDPDAEHNYMGESVARWDGPVLTIDTTSLNGLTWLDHKGLPASDKTHVVEKIRLVDPDTLEDVITVTDPENYSAPWSFKVVYDKRNDLKLQQHICGEPDNRKLPIPPAPR